MSTDEFWKIIGRSRENLDPKKADGNMQRQLRRLDSLLVRLELSQIVSLRDTFRRNMGTAYRWDLWGAAHIIGHGCSDDAFVDFRSWLISMGENAFAGALANPESLASIAADPRVEDVFFEGFQNVFSRAYERNSGKAIPVSAVPHPKTPVGKKWKDESDLRLRFPKLWQGFRES